MPTEEKTYFLCASAELEEGGLAHRFEIRDQDGEHSAFLVRFDGQPRAYFNRCAHIAVELDWQPGRIFDDQGLYLVCASHGALYEPDSGQCVAGPCVGQKLHALNVVEQNGQIFWYAETGQEWIA
jgi:nitrite reductase/ring-hydroxylating ferredoxin subunit